MSMDVLNTLTYWLFTVFTWLCIIAAITGVGLWIRRLVRTFARFQLHALRKKDVTSLSQVGWNTGLPTVFIPFMYVFSSQSLEGLNLQILASLFILAGVLFLVQLVLWLLTWYLYTRPRVPISLYWLPQAAEEVRLRECMNGINFAALTYPEAIALTPDLVEIIVRATNVSMRIEVFNQRDAEGFQLTNDFKVYCDLAIEGFQAGFFKFVKECQAAPDHFEVLRQSLDDDALSREQFEELLSPLAQRFLGELD